MTQTITAIYESGVLRPLAPLDLPEHARVRIYVENSPREARLSPQSILARKVLIDAGLVMPGIEPERFPSRVLSSERREELARLFSGNQPLSDIIISEREGR